MVSGVDINLGGSSGAYGGFIAYLGNGGAIRDFGFTGDVTLTRTGTGSVQVGVGALVGWTLASTITRSFATGDVSVNVTASATDANATARTVVGGLVGNLQGTMSDSYSTGDISVTSTSTVTGTGTSSVQTSIGGLTGSMQTLNSVINRTYSTGAVVSSTSATGGTSQSVTERTGGSVGIFNGTFATATATVWDTTSSGLSTGIGSGSSANITGKTASEMTTLSTFTAMNWDIATGYDTSKVWNLCPALNGGKPVLSKFVSEATCYFPPRTPTMSSPVSTEGGFTVQVTNYDASWAWTATVTDGAATLGTPSGSVLPVIVTGLAPGAPATLTLTTTRTDYRTGSASVGGRALPPPPVPATAPRAAVASAGDRLASVSWQVPESQGSFPVSTYLVQSRPGRHTCMVPSTELTCSVSGLANGTAYTFTVQALNGAGWSVASNASNAVTPAAAPRPSIVISGSRDGRRIEVAGRTTSFGMGGTLRPWLRFAGQSTYSEGAATILVSMNGTFEWGRKSSKKVSMYVQTPDGSVRSNPVTIQAP